MKAHCASFDISNSAFVHNVSEQGIFIQTGLADKKTDLETGIPVELQIELPSGEKIDLNCEIRWSAQNPPSGLTSSVGMFIKDPPKEYKKFIKSLSNPKKKKKK